MKWCKYMYNRYQLLCTCVRMQHLPDWYQARDKHDTQTHLTTKSSPRPCHRMPKYKQLLCASFIQPYQQLSSSTLLPTYVHACMPTKVSLVSTKSPRDNAWWSLRAIYPKSVNKETSVHTFTDTA